MRYIIIAAVMLAVPLAGCAGDAPDGLPPMPAEEETEPSLSVPVETHEDVAEPPNATPTTASPSALGLYRSEVTPHLDRAEERVRHVDQRMAEIRYRQGVTSTMVEEIRGLAEDQDLDLRRVQSSFHPDGVPWSDIDLAQAYTERAIIHVFVYLRTVEDCATGPYNTKACTVSDADRDQAIQSVREAFAALYGR